ncbi:selenide, water dikinase SelD [Puniceibacterium sediminis]|uniref:Selenophosphate synthase n=1 Tax=Puniceibacterium sediminis TaxID=1608407 RepID=A0A238Z5B8_9RHOB|nr:selenide, water dikinase SelD [Puniceibacterium sediminis]SNR78587.1 selenophosphate synthase [Puniceibacterium sediminis]
MHQPPLPLTRDLLLIGGGHTHALVLRKWGMTPLPGVRLTLVNPGPTAPYSGMLPGHIAGHYSRDALDIDLVKLARFAGARLVNGAVDGIDLTTRTVNVPDRPAIGFDVLSVDIGITSAMPTVPGFSEHAVPAKPLGPFASAWDHYLNTDGPASIAVIGGGVAGAEIAMAMAFALRSRGRPYAIHLLDRSKILGGLGGATARKILASLDSLDIQLHENTRIAAVTNTSVTLDNGTQIPAGFVTGAAGARPYDWLQTSGLTLHDGYITVDTRLCSSDAAIFAAGDCAHFAADPRPKAGVFAVRQAPVLYHNLRATLIGTGRLRSYRPQRDYLKLISMGGKMAVAERFGLPLSGPLMWRWKDHIDQKFMRKFTIYPVMRQPALPWPRAAEMQEALGPKPMCGGCGAKVGRGTLNAVLRDLPPHQRSDITALPGDDAALLRMGQTRQVLSTDHLRSLTDDPDTMTRITANHALGDVWAMGAQPQAALVSLVLPRLSETLTRRLLSEIMQTAHQSMSAAGAEIVGGHSSVGDELTIGFTITGLCEADPITLAGGQPGDVLILTKPIGSGVIMAADMAGDAAGHDVIQCLDLMVQSQAQASRILSCAHAMTDVTGFGLAGHLLSICEASGTEAELRLASIPLMAGALDLSERGHRSSLYPQNRSAAPHLPDTARAALLFDPQTAGGLLAAVPQDSASEVLSALIAAGYPAVAIGCLTTGMPQINAPD